MRRLLPALLLACAATPAAADGAGTTAAEFLLFGAGAPAAMSEAGGAIAADAYAPQWNPAGLAAGTSKDAYVAHASLPEGISQQYGALAWPLRGGSVAGYALQLQRSGSIEKLDNAGNPAGSFSATDMAHTLSWARDFSGLRAGASLRLVSQAIDGESGTAFALGAGLQKDWGDWTAGASLANLGGELKLRSEGAPLPMSLRAGGGRRLFDRCLLLAVDVTSVRGRETRAHLGLDYAALKASGSLPGLSVRAGYAAGDHDADGASGLAAGVSVSAGRVRADFSWLPWGELGSVIQAGLGFSF